MGLNTDRLASTGQRLTRAHLLQRFKDSLDRRLTLIEAPAGYGKTTLIMDWVADLRASGKTCIFVQRLGDAIRTLTFEEQILASLIGVWAKEDFNKPVSAGSTTDDTASTLISILGILAAAPSDTFLVFDDVHECAPAEADFLRKLIINADRRAHFVIATREPLAIPLTKLRVDGQMTEFGVEDLRLTRAEVDDLLTDSPISGYAEMLYDYTEGWIAALQLVRQGGSAILSSGLDLRKGIGRQADLVSYLNEHFFLGLAPELQTFLVDTAHLTNLNGDLADYVRSKDNSWAVLAELARSHSLVFEVPGPDPSYRYHQLLREFLAVRQASLGERKVRILQLRTAEWHFSNGFLAHAVNYAIAAKDMPRAIDMVLEAGCVRIGLHQGAPRLSACLDQIPLHAIHSNPRLIIARAYLLLKAARFAEAILYLDEARTMIEPADKRTHCELVIVEAHLRIYDDQHLTDAQLAALDFNARETPVTDEIMRGIFSNFLCYFNIRAGNLVAARNHGEYALQIFHDLKTVHLQFFMYLHLSMIDLDWGNYEAALDKRQKALDLSRCHFRHDPALRALANIYFGEIEFEMGGAVEGSARLCEALEQASRAEGWNEAFLSGYETCLKWSFKSSGYDAAISNLAQAEATVSRRASRRFLRQLCILELELALDAGNDLEIDRLTHQVIALLKNTDEQDKLRWRGRILARLAIARAWSRSGDVAAALHLIEEVAVDCRSKELNRYLLRSEVLRTVVLAQSLDWEAAFKSLRLVLELSSPGFFGAMFRQAEEFSNAARHCLQNGGLGAFSPTETRKLADILWVCAGHPVSASHSVLAELLTSRELAVLRLIAFGQPNKVIARELGLTDATVKFHLKNVFGKLGVNSRKLAAHVAVAHGVLGS